MKRKKIIYLSLTIVFILIFLVSFNKSTIFSGVGIFGFMAFLIILIHKLGKDDLDLATNAIKKFIKKILKAELHKENISIPDFSHEIGKAEVVRAWILRKRSPEYNNAAAVPDVTIKISEDEDNLSKFTEEHTAQIKDLLNKIIHDTSTQRKEFGLPEDGRTKKLKTYFIIQAGSIKIRVFIGYD